MSTKTDSNCKSILEIVGFLIENGATALEVAHGDVSVKCNLDRSVLRTISAGDDAGDEKDNPEVLWKAFSESTYYAGSDE